MKFKNIITAVNIFLIGSVLIVYSCKKTVIETKEVIKTHSWRSDSSLSGFFKIISSSVKVDDTTLAVYNKEVMTIINSNNLNKSTTGAYLAVDYGSLLPISLSKRFGVFPIDQNRLRIFSVLQPNWNLGSFIFDASYSNSTTALKGFPLPYTNAGYSIVNDKYILAPIEVDYYNEIAKCNLIRVDAVDGIAGSIQLGNVTDVFLPAKPSTGSFTTGNYFSFSYFNKFFLTLSDQFFRVDTLGNVKAFGKGALPTQNSSVVTQMFSIGNYLFAITGVDILVSTDFGETWSVFKSSPGFEYIVMKYQNVGNEVYAYYNSQIFKITLTGSSLNYQELDNDGLSTNQITGINKVGKYAFVSTLSGLFYRDTLSFNTPK